MRLWKRVSDVFISQFLRLGPNAAMTVEPTPGTVLTITPNELANKLDASRLMVAGGSAISATAAHDGRIIALDTAAGTTVTLPAATGSGIRIRCMVTVLATSNSHKVQVANASDVMAGGITTIDTDTAGTVTGFATAASSDTVTLNRSTTGSVTIGEYVEFIDVLANKWAVSGLITCTGTGATPFSAAV